ncbi:hypothetical protein [Streptomyces spectabilis]|uniref:hypothetical protein n=1 Tax=Streptomyces spectabilis TaxID=68270 RepID=UPI001F61113B|nr:hypothetical protein [Streptomyces spectabilis]MCI3901442.1 hypothetical protein [Streptomyces spectabilis]
MDRDWVLSGPRPAAEDSDTSTPADHEAAVADLLAPFDRLAPERSAGRIDGDPVSGAGRAVADRASGSDRAVGAAASEAGSDVADPASRPGHVAGDPAAASGAEGEGAPPPPPASARLPDAPPAPANPPRPGVPEARGPRPGTVPPRSRASAARRARGAVDLSPRPDGHRPFVFLARPALYDDTTTRLRPVAAWLRPRAAAAAACAVLGLGLIGGAVTGSWLTGESDAAGGSRDTYAAAGTLWHSLPVDALFPPTIKGGGAGPGGADRVWNRVAVAPDSGCAKAFDPLLRKALAPVGCRRLLRATYTDATKSHLTTVGLLFTKADADGMHALRTRFGREGLDRRTDLMPRAYAARGTPAAVFGAAQRATWTLSVLPDAPVVAYAVSGFADGRAVTEPEPAAEAMKAGATSAPAQAGLGHDAKGIADRVERSLRKTATAAPEKP